ncbi:MAG TPA: glycosyltransferase family 1 protein, partial [Desulfobacteria bacterium]|nr:glycosyltransferase family 1 protein [Desulfobacteria bacterium]
PTISLLSRQKTVVTVHDLSYLYFPDAYSFGFRAFYNFIIPLIMKHSDKIITVSQSEKKSILKHYKYAGDRLIAIQNGGLNRNYLDELEGINPAESGKPFVIYVGSLSRRKNLQGVIEAVALLNKRIDVPAVVVGAGGKSFKNDQFGVPEEAVRKIDFKGQVNDTQYILSLYKAASCLVFPSFYEASPLPPIEAMACGCPVIASPIPSLLERCGKAAIYADPDDPADIADKIEQILGNSVLAAELRDKGLEHAGKFTWENCARHTWAAIRDIIG